MADYKTFESLEDICEYLTRTDTYPDNIKEIAQRNNWELLFNHNTSATIKDENGRCLIENIDGLVKYYVVPPYKKEFYSDFESAKKAAQQYCDKWNCDIRDSVIETINACDAQSFSMTCAKGKSSHLSGQIKVIVIIKHTPNNDSTAVALFAYKNLR